MAELVQQRKSLDNKNVNFPSQFCLGSISNKIGYVDEKEVSLIGNALDFSITMLLINLTY